MINSSAGEEVISVWGPGEGYKIAYLHSAIVERSNSTMINFQNQPITEFRVGNFTNNDYTYNYRGHGNITYSKKVNMAIEPVDDKIIEYPTGGFPVVLPIKFNDHDEWLKYFGEQNIDYYNVELDDPFFLFNTQVAIKDTVVEFKRDTYSRIIDFDKNNILSSIQFLNGLEGMKVYNSSISTRLTYSISTGALFQLNYTVNSFEFPNNTIPFRISEQIDFVAIIPLIALLNQLDLVIQPIWLVVIVILKRKLIDKK